MQAARTRAAWLEVRRTRDETRDGHALLERKREVLLREVWDLMRAASHRETELRATFEAAHAAARTARVEAGRDVAWVASWAPSAHCVADVGVRSLMGVDLPQVDLHVERDPLPTAAGASPATLDVARRRWLDVVEALGTWSETYGAVWRVAAELARTQRRVRSLEEVVLPQLEAQIAAIEATLEEAEREAFVRSKRVKARLEAARTEDDDA